MSDHERCAEVCEEYGFARQADVLRSVARGGLHAFAVCARLGDGDYLEEEGGVPVALFLDRAAAESEARRRELLAFRTLNLYEYTGINRDITFISDPTEDLEQKISEILGTDYKLPDPDTHAGSFFPADTTDQQMWALSSLFDVDFFYVAELEFVDGANLLPSTESSS